ncbi:MAG: PadR family transcriptional regulator [Brachybacterium sp.]|nr:PadR family transcriptional regulator [Brachybacterium sp.]
MIGADAIRGHIDLIVLAILQHEPSYAYAIARSITESSGSDFVIKQTTLYTALKRLEKAGLLTSYEAHSDTGRPRTYYALTPDGTAHLIRLRAEWEATRTLVDHFATAAWKDKP